jgi:hypothetical protein
VEDGGESVRMDEREWKRGVEDRELMRVKWGGGEMGGEEGVEGGGE